MFSGEIASDREIVRRAFTDNKGELSSKNDKFVKDTSVQTKSQRLLAKNRSYVNYKFR